MDFLHLEQQLRQELHLTPELLQSLSVLQMNAEELQDFLNRSLEENPVLEAEDSARREREAAELLQKTGLRYRTIGEGETVTAQLPAALWQIARGTETILYLGAEISNEKEIVPNLAGMRYNEARDMLSRYGIYLHSLSTVIDGELQSVSTQSGLPGSVIEHGSVIEVSLVSNDESMLGKY